MSTEQDFTITDSNRQLESVASFNADEPLTLSATNASGRIEVRTDSSRPAGTALIAVRRTDDNEFDDDDHALTIKTDGNSISIHPDWQFAAGLTGLARRFRDQLQHGFRPEDWNLSRIKLSPELDFHIFITLPMNLAENSQIKVRTASGEIDARDIDARVSIVTASGDVEAADLTGVIAINTASGDVRATNITDSLEINTASGDASIFGGDIWLAARSASGDVSVQDTRLRNSRVTTVSGDVSIRAIFDNTGNYGMETVSGDVTLDSTFPGQGVVATLGFGTLSGSSNVATAWEKRKRREWSIGSGDVGPGINVKTVSGDLSAKAQLDDAVEARSLSMPRVPKYREDEQEDPLGGDFKHEMHEFKREMKYFGKEMKHMGHVTPPTPPTPPMPATPAIPPMPSRTANQSADKYEQAIQEYEETVERLARDHEQVVEAYEREVDQHARDHDQTIRNHEQRTRDREQRRRDHEQRRMDRRRDREQRNRDREQRRGKRKQEREPHAIPDRDSHIFTAGPSGRPYREPQPEPAQPTEPVSPPQPFEDEATTDQPVTANDPQHTEPDMASSDNDEQASSPDPTKDDRITILELLERGEIDIDEAMARLESARDTSTSS